MGWGEWGIHELSISGNNGVCRLQASESRIYQGISRPIVSKEPSPM